MNNNVIIEEKTGKEIYQGKSIKDCREYGKKNNLRSPDYYVKRTFTKKKIQNDTCIDQSDISNFY